MRPRQESAPPSLPVEMIEGLEALEELDGVDVLDDWRWDSKEQCWTLRCRLTVPVPEGSTVPRRSDWLVLVEGNYPWGFINVQPAKRNGIETTFPHQSLNRLPSPDREWRTGRICVDNGVRALGRQGVDREPYSARDRLRWRMQRAHAWVAAATRGDLARPGEPFELPDLDTLPTPLVAFSEDVSSLITWDSETTTAGIASLAWVRAKPLVFAVTSYRAPDGREVFAPRWGTFISDPERESAWAGWIRLKNTPVLPPWRAALTWGELRTVATAQGVDLDTQLRTALDPLRDGHGHVLLVGFPIPAVIGEPPVSYYWQAIQIAPLPPTVNPDRRGFRPGKAPFIDVAKAPQFRDDAGVKWLRTENWHPSTIAARGRLPETITSAEVLVIGAGALGSAVAELLVRGGVERLTIYDDDIVMAGNLVRHTLALGEVGRYKAAALADRLNAASPQAVVRAITKAFPPSDERARSALRPIDVVIDCTGENSVAHALATYPWTGDKLFASISLGLRAWAGFSYIAFGESFPFESFLRDLQPWLDRQATQFEGTEWPREGVGCWHPVFPARADEVWLLAAAAVQHLVDTATRVVSEMDASLPSSELAVYVRSVEQSGAFAGLTRADGAPDA